MASASGTKQVDSSPYYPKWNGYSENEQSFFKTCIRKHVSSTCIRDKVAHLACGTYNPVPIEHSKESALFLTSDKNAYTPFMQLLNFNIRYMGDQQSLLALENMYMLTIHDIKLSRERQVELFITHPVPKFQIGDKVEVINHTRDSWDPKHDSVYRVVLA